MDGEEVRRCWILSEFCLVIYGYGQLRWGALILYLGYGTTNSPSAQHRLTRGGCASRGTVGTGRYV